MNKSNFNKDNFKKLILTQAEEYPELTVIDIFKFIYQSAFGCEHLVSSFKAAYDYILKEYETVNKEDKGKVEPLYGEYSRVYLSVINEGLSPKTLAKLFCLSSRKEEGEEKLRFMLSVSRELVLEERLPFSLADFDSYSNVWKNTGYGAVRHSDVYREEYHPAYRVVANRYVNHLPLFTEIDGFLSKNTEEKPIFKLSREKSEEIRTILEEIYMGKVTFE